MRRQAIAGAAQPRPRGSRTSPRARRLTVDEERGGRVRDLGFGQDAHAQERLRRAVRLGVRELFGRLGLNE
jgi:hypothetical protein